MRKFKVYNGFGIIPTKTHLAAGYDFYIPKFENIDKKKFKTIIDAFSKSYGIDTNLLEEMFNTLNLYIESENSKTEKNWIDKPLNALQLFLGMKSRILKMVFNNDKVNKQSRINDLIKGFVDYDLIYDKNGIPGINVICGTSLFFNTGLKFKLEKDTAGIFLNKSGMGNKGYDVRAQVVDQDYAGYVHLSAEYTSELDNILYCGDKLLQMLIIDVPSTEIEEIDDETLVNLHKESERGTDGFGSSDIKH